MVWWQDGLVVIWFGGEMVWWQDGLVTTEDGLVARWFGGKMVWWRDDHKPYDSTDPVSRHILEGAFPSYLQEVRDCLCPGCMLEQLLQPLHILAEMLTSATTTQIYPLHENEEP